MHQADKNLFKGAFPGLKVSVFDTEIAKRAEQSGYPCLLSLGVEGVYQLVTIL